MFKLVKVRILLFLCLATVVANTFAAEWVDNPLNIRGYKKIEDFDFDTAICYAKLNVCLIFSTIGKICEPFGDPRSDSDSYENAIRKLQNMQRQANVELSILENRAITESKQTAPNYRNYHDVCNYVSKNLAEVIKIMRERQIEYWPPASTGGSSDSSSSSLVALYKDCFAQAKASELSKPEDARMLYRGLIRDGRNRSDIPEITALVAEAQTALERLNGVGRSSAASASSSAAPNSQDQSSPSSTVLRVFSKLKFW